MPELLPDSIYSNYKDRVISKDSAIKQLISIIENSESIEVRIESIEILGKIGSNDEETYKLLENLLISDSYEKTRIAAAKALRVCFLERSLEPMEWALEHEESNTCLNSIFETLIKIIKNLRRNNDEITRKLLLEELNKIKDKEFKIGLQVLQEKNKNLSIWELSEILINYFCLTFLKKTFWRIKYKIKDCYIIDLSFKFKGLTQIPIAIKYLRSLKKLKLRYNQIVNVPEWIGKLASLEVLNLNMNNINELPESIGDLKSLKELHLWKNELKTLPKSIGNLKYLEKLILRINHLLELPGTIVNLTSLKELDVHDNHLAELPLSIGNLKSLNTLNLSWNELISLPDSICDLSSLKILDMGGNELVSLPHSVCKLPFLEYLNLSRNEIIELPESLLNLNSLKELYIGENKIKKLPKHLKDLEERGVKIYFESYF